LLGSSWREAKLPSSSTEQRPIGFPQRAIQGACFGGPHLGAAGERRNVRRIGISKPNESARTPGLANGAFKDPAARNGIAKIWNLLNAHFDASLALS